MGRRTGTMLAGLAAAVMVSLVSGFWPVRLVAQTPAQQTVPDAPKPQTLPKLNTVVPTAPALPDAPQAATNADTTEAQAPSALPGAPTAPPSTESNDVEIPRAGDGPKQIIRVSSTFVEVPFIVKDVRGQMVPGLTNRDIQIYENGTKQNIRFFTTDPFPLSVALVIDQSVTFDTMTRINNSLGALQSAFSPYDEVAVFTYNNGVKMQDPIGFDGATSARLGAILERSKGKGREPNMDLGGPLAQTTLINNQNVDPNTSPNHRTSNVTEYAEREFHTLNDAILAAAIQVAKAGGGRRRIVYVISDGKEYGSKAHEKDVVKFCQTNKISVYATLIGDSSLPVVGILDRVHLPLTMRDNALPRYTIATGGQLDAEVRESGIEKSFAKITSESRNQYTAGYYTRLSPLNEKFRTLEVMVLKPNLSVTAKQGYYPTVSDSRPSPAPATKPPVSPSPAPKEQ